MGEGLNGAVTDGPVMPTVVVPIPFCLLEDGQFKGALRLNFP
jgi:hypothetical protein